MGKVLIEQEGNITTITQTPRNCDNNKRSDSTNKLVREEKKKKNLQFIYLQPLYVNKLYYTNHNYNLFQKKNRENKYYISSKYYLFSFLFSPFQNNILQKS